MKILGLILVVFYAVLMLFALWKQHSKTAPPMDGASPADGSSPDGGASPAGGSSPAGSTSPAGGSPSSEHISFMNCISSFCIGSGCLLLLAYSLLYIAQNRSRMPLLLIGMLCISAGTLLNGIRLKKVHIHHHIIRLIIEAVMIALCWMSAGGRQAEMPTLETRILDGSLAVIWEDRTYVPFCVVSKSDCGDLIGCLDNDTDDRISTYKDYPAEQWLTSWLPMDGGAILLKEITVTEIPDGLEDGLKEMLPVFTDHNISEIFYERTADDCKTFYCLL